MTIGNDLSKIYSSRKQIEIFDILDGIRPTHNERIWMVSFLRYAGYSYDEVIDIIDNHCAWSDYDPQLTQYQVATIFHLPHRNNSTTSSKRRVRKWDLLPTEVYRIKLARSTESHRELQRWAKENGVPIYDACPELPFNPALMEQQK